MAITDFLTQEQLTNLLNQQFDNQGIARLNPLAFQFEDATQPYSTEQMRALKKMRLPGREYPFGFGTQDPAFFSDFTTGYNYDPIKGTKEDFNYLYGTRPAFQFDTIDTDEEDEEDQLPYSGVGDMRYQTPRTIADQNRILGQTFTEQKPSGIARLFEVLGNLPTPMNILRGGLESLQGFNQRIRSTPFARSKTLAEYFDRRSRAKNAARMAEKYQDFSERTSGAGATGGDRDFSTPAGKSTSYEEASRGFAASR